MQIAHGLNKSNAGAFLKQAITLLAGVLLLTLASQISIPLQPVPLTFQSATVILLGLVLGSRQATAITITYLIAGLLGIPVFANFQFGLAALIGPTGGYLLGFIPAAFITGCLAEHGWGKHIFTSFIAACAGAAFIFTFGIVMLANYIGWHQAYTLGLLPFIISEPCKLAFISLFAPKLWK